jgi:hypothetical protein
LNIRSSRNRKVRSTCSFATGLVFDVRSGDVAPQRTLAAAHPGSLCSRSSPIGRRHHNFSCRYRRPQQGLYLLLVGLKGEMMLVRHLEDQVHRRCSSRAEGSVSAMPRQAEGLGLVARPLFLLSSIRSGST